MRFRTKAAVLILCAVMLLYCLPAHSAGIDEGLIDIVFEKLDSLDPQTKEDAVSLLKDYFATSESLDSLKQDVPGILRLVIGEDYKTSLAEKGLTVEKIRDEIDWLKKWDKQDRMNVLDMAKQRDAARVKALLDKYESVRSEDNVPPGGPGGGTGTGDVEGPPEQPAFTDIQQHWAKPYIEFMSSKAIVKGKAKGIFAPEDRVTRAEFTTMLVRLLGLEQNGKSGMGSVLPFTDVSEKDWFYEAVKTAYNFELAKGRGDKFDPQGLVTREEMVALITRAASIKNKSAFIDSIEIDALLSVFKDKNSISDWAKTDISVALKLGLVHGMSPDEFAPKATATRAQAAAAMYNLYTAIYE